MSTCGRNDVSGAVVKKVGPKLTLAKAKQQALTESQAAIAAAIKSAQCPGSCKFLNDLQTSNHESVVLIPGKPFNLQVRRDWTVSYICRPQLTLLVPDGWIQKIKSSVIA